MKHVQHTLALIRWGIIVTDFTTCILYNNMNYYKMKVYNYFNLLKSILIKINYIANKNDSTVLIKTKLTNEKWIWYFNWELLTTTEANQQTSLPLPVTCWKDSTYSCVPSPSIGRTKARWPRVRDTSFMLLQQQTRTIWGVTWKTSRWLDALLSVFCWHLLLCSKNNKTAK